MSLVQPGQFLLIAGEDGQSWCAAAKELAAIEGYPIRGIRIGVLDGDYRDPRCAWLLRREIGLRGAVLVRPDRYVGWRSLDASADPRGELGAVLSKMLCRTHA
jgi:2,4-dichlorophenol 6-monooxygenase